MTDWVRFFALGPGLPFAAYVVLQIVALIKLRGAWRIAVVLPIPFVVWTVVSTVEAYEAESNLWPLGLMGGGGFAALFVVLVLLASRLSSSRKRQSDWG